MSSHHSQEAINLHHQQVSAGKARRMQKHEEKRQRYLTMRQEARANYNAALCFAFIWFAYMNIGTAVYLGYVI